MTYLGTCSTFVTTTNASTWATTSTLDLTSSGLIQAREALHCWACGKPGPGITALNDGRHVHRWPCRDRLR